MSELDTMRSRFRRAYPVTRRSLLASTAAAAIFPHAALAQSSARTSRGAGVKTFRLAHSVPTTHGWHTWAARFKEKIEATSDGKLKVEIFPNAQLGTDREIAQAVRINSIEMGATGVGLMNWLPEVSVTDTPFLFRDRTQAYAAFDGAFGNELKSRSVTKAGLKLLGFCDLGSRAMTNSKRPINSVADMQGLKMRVPDSKSYTALIQAMGASIVTLDLSELYLALSQGVADGQETPLPVVRSLKLYEVQKYLSKTDHALTTSYIVMNAGVFQGLASDEQQLVTAASDDATQYLRGRTQQEEAEVIEFVKSRGVEVNSAPDTGSFREVCQKLVASLPELFPPDLIKLAQSA